MWIALAVIIVPLLILDLGVFHKKAHTPTFKESLLWTIVWFSLAVIFAIALFIYEGSQYGTWFITGYLLELSLSADNVFVFALIFGSLGIPEAYRHRVLFIGILTAIILRAIMIFVGVALVKQFSWMLIVFGAFLIFTAIKMMLMKDHGDSPGESKVVRWLEKRMPVTKELHGQRFFIKQNGKLVATPLFVALILIEWADVVFALDSVPAILGVTQDGFIVFSSNLFAILGLRSLYFLLSGAMNKFFYLKHGLSIILLFIGLKMVHFFKLFGIDHFDTRISLVVIVSILVLSIVASLIKARNTTKPHTPTPSDTEGEPSVP